MAAMRIAGMGMRVAQGIDITSTEIRIVRLGCCFDERLDDHEVVVLDAVCEPIPCGWVTGADIIDPDALGSALADCLYRQQLRVAAMSAVGEGADAAGEPTPETVAARASAMVDTHEAGWGMRGDRHRGSSDMAMSLCPSVVIQQRVALTELMPGFRMRLPHRDTAAFDALAPWVLLHAQKMSGIDPTDLLVDWYRAAPGDIDHVVVAAAQRHYLNVRHRVIDRAGGRLCALGDAAAAALGACRFVVARSLHAPRPPDDPVFVDGACFLPSAADLLSPLSGLRVNEVDGDNVFGPGSVQHQQAAALAAFDRTFRSQRFGALWIGEGVWRAWTFDATGGALQGVSLPDANEDAGCMRRMLDLLQEAVTPPPALLLVAGEQAALAPVGGMGALRDRLGCPVIAFDASACCVGPAATPQQLGPTAAVAFGLAWRELLR